MNEKYDIFISYSRSDLKKVKAIKAELELTTNAKCWMDLEGIESGVPRFTKAIIDGIKNTSVFLFMRSKDSQSSEFALRELRFASKHKRHVVIVNIDDSQMTEEFDFMFGLSDTITWDNMPQRNKLFRDIIKWAEITVENTLPLFENENDKAVAEKQVIISDSIKPTFIQERTKSPNRPIFKNHKNWIVGLIGLCVLTIIISLSASYLSIKKPANEVIYDSIADSTEYVDSIVVQDGNDISHSKIELDSNDETTRVQDNNRRSEVADNYGNDVTSRKWKKIFKYSEGLACVLDDYGRYGFIDKTGKIVITCRWKYAGFFSEGLACVLNDNGRYGYIDKTGLPVIHCKWKYAGPFNEGLAWIMDDHLKYGYIDKTGKVVIPCKWEEASDFNGGFAIVKDGKGSELVIDKHGKMIEENLPVAE